MEARKIACLFVGWCAIITLVGCWSEQTEQPELTSGSPTDAAERSSTDDAAGKIQRDTGDTGVTGVTGVTGDPPVEPDPVVPEQTGQLPSAGNDGGGADPIPEKSDGPGLHAADGDQPDKPDADSDADSDADDDTGTDAGGGADTNRDTDQQADTYDAEPDGKSPQEMTDQEYYEYYGEERYVTDTKQPDIRSNWVRLHPEQEIWIDKDKKQVILGGRICIRRGPLEMFACPEGLKEHESVVAVRSSAFNVHTALLAVGAVPVSPVQFEPEYKPVEGTPVKIEVTWLVDGKPKTIDARQMVRNVETGEALETHWVFGGSGSEIHPATGERYYFGDSGMLICVANFTIATMDIPVKSTDLNEYWMFEAFTENVPRRGTEVLVTLTPLLDSEEHQAVLKKAEQD